MSRFNSHATPKLMEELKGGLSANLIDGGILLELSEQDWRELVPLLGPRKVLMKQLKERSEKEICSRSAMVQTDPATKTGEDSSKIAVSHESNCATEKEAANTATDVSAHKEEHRAQEKPSQKTNDAEVKKDSDNVAALGAAGAATLAADKAVEMASKASESQKACKPAPLKLSAIEAKEPQTLSEYLTEKRPNTIRERICFLPESVRFAHPNDLLSRSMFSNVPMLDYDNYRPMIEGESCCDTTWQRILYRVKYGFYEVIFFIMTLFKLVSWIDLLNILLVNCLTTVYSWELESHQHQYRAHPAMVISVAVFPIAFAVNAAYQRREAALQLLARLKSCIMNLYLLHRCWSNLPALPPDFIVCSRNSITCCFHEMRGYLIAGSELEKGQRLLKVYDLIAEVCRSGHCFVAALHLNKMCKIFASWKASEDNRFGRVAKGAQGGGNNLFMCVAPFLRRYIDFYAVW